MRHSRPIHPPLLYAAAAMALAWMPAAFDHLGPVLGQVPPSPVLDLLPPPPPQPSADSWAFIDDLRAPLWSDHGWRAREPLPGEADLRAGVLLVPGFADPDALLETAHTDLREFLAAGRVPRDGPYRIETAKCETECFEAFSVEVGADCCRILAADTEGIRRGIFQVEDMMRRAGGPFLPLGTVVRKPLLKSRISRCFFGPIKRPPMNRDELDDDEDYYPDNYLNRLAHEGINGLWLTVTFRDLCRTSLTPDAGADRDRRLAKLRRTVEKCRRHGIGIYLFMIEPAAWTADDQAPQLHPEVAGAPGYPAGTRMFCPWSDAARRHLYEATHGIFSAVPHLAGLINICHGERPTNCQSSVPAYADRKPACDVCKKREPWEIVRETLAPMAQGVHDAAPGARVIAWFYVPYEWGEPAPWVYELPRHLPENVIVQFNFESGVEKQDLGRSRKGGDYWLSAPGPSGRFDRIAAAARDSGRAVSAKIQTGCSHEVATIPFVPVPGLLWRKFAGMRELGVSHAMLCWYFGNYPGLMNKASGELALEPFPATEDEFLSRLAALEWGRHAAHVTAAWKLLAEGYGHYPLTNSFQYYGPMHDGVVWPLLLRPLDAPLAPSWLLASRAADEPYAPSGDRIGECLATGYTLSEAIEACRRLVASWDRGVALLRNIEADPDLAADRRRDIGLARALGIQFRSGLDILRFYDLRERMAHAPPEKQPGFLAEMRAIVEAELAGGKELIGLCAADPRLGFHSEAEGYRYFPAKIRWRLDQLARLRDVEMPALEREIAAGGDPFAEYTGRSPGGPVARSTFVADVEAFLQKPLPELPTTGLESLAWQRSGHCEPPSNAAGGFRWACCHDREALYLLFDCDDTKPGPMSDLATPAEVVLKLEPRRLWPCAVFGVSRTGTLVRHRGRPEPVSAYDAAAAERPGGWRGWIRVPLAGLHDVPADHGPLRINVIGIPSVAGGHTAAAEQAWITRRPWPLRGFLGDDNPADLGWLLFDDRPAAGNGDPRTR